MISMSEEEERARTGREGLGLGLGGGLAGELDPKGLVEYLFGDEDDKVEGFDFLAGGMTGGLEEETEARIDARRSVAPVFEPFFLRTIASSVAGARRTGSLLTCGGSDLSKELLGSDLVKGAETKVV